MQSEIFKKEILEKESTVEITIYCDYRTHAMQPKAIFHDSVAELVPESFKTKGDITMISQPDKQISNINTDEYVNSGTWVFEVVKEKKKITKPTSNTRTATRRSKRSVKKA